MPSRPREDEYELLHRQSSESDNVLFDPDTIQYQSQRQSRKRLGSRIATFVSRLLPLHSKNSIVRQRGAHRLGITVGRVRCGRLRPSRRFYLVFNVCFAILAALTLCFGIIRPSYTNPPAHYQALRNTIEISHDYGRGNPKGQKIFIAASIYDQGGKLLGGEWGNRVLDLIDILGSRNVFLSIYENGAGSDSISAQARFEELVQCKHHLKYDHEISMNDVERVTMPDGSRRVKRIAYLADVRNHALSPLEVKPIVKYDKILFLNDVIFDPIDAVQLLLSTHSDELGRPNYRAACAVDFINPFKFYDTYATRDLDGYSMGVPFFPWFTNSGSGISRGDVLQGKDAVRVKSCWGGMVAFDARPFQSSEPLRFRALPDLYWDASECCLIHADLMNDHSSIEEGDSVGIYMNPFVRVAYSSRTFRWLSFTRRFERLYTVPHSIINYIVGLPWLNPRQKEIVGAQVEESVWVPNATSSAGGAFQLQSRVAVGDGFCGRRALQLIKEVQRAGEKNWEVMPVPSG